MSNEKEYEIHWVITNKKTLETEAHELKLIDKEMFWQQLQFLVEVNTKRKNNVDVNFKSSHECILTVWS